MALAETLAEQLDGARDWTLRLIADFAGEQEWGFQPAPDLGNAAWLCGHLAFAEDGLIFRRCFEKSLLSDEFVAPFMMGQTPRPLTGGGYPPIDEIRNTMDRVHAEALAAVRSLSDEQLLRPAPGKPHPHFTDTTGLLTHAARHEAFHAGQLAWLRRLLGKPALR